MRFTLALAVVLAAAAVCDSSIIKADPRSNLSVGWISSGDRRLHSSYINRAAIANAFQSQDVIWRGNSTNRISAVQATEVGSTQWATARIIGGGIGWNYVNIRFESYRSRGYYYLLDIWGR